MRSGRKTARISAEYIRAGLILLKVLFIDVSSRSDVVDNYSLRFLFETINNAISSDPGPSVFGQLSFERFAKKWLGEKLFDAVFDPEFGLRRNFGDSARGFPRVYKLHAWS